MRAPFPASPLYPGTNRPLLRISSALTLKHLRSHLVDLIAVDQERGFGFGSVQYGTAIDRKKTPSKRGSFTSKPNTDSGASHADRSLRAFAEVGSLFAMSGMTTLDRCMQSHSPTAIWYNNYDEHGQFGGWIGFNDIAINASNLLDLPVEVQRGIWKTR